MGAELARGLWGQLIEWSIQRAIKALPLASNYNGSVHIRSRGNRIVSEH